VALLVPENAVRFSDVLGEFEREGRRGTVGNAMIDR
jgi:hypothetical protein